MLLFKSNSSWEVIQAYKNIVFIKKIIVKVCDINYIKHIYF